MISTKSSINRKYSIMQFIYPTFPLCDICTICRCHDILPLLCAWVVWASILLLCFLIWVMLHCSQVSQPSSSNASNASVSLGAGNSPPSLSTCIQETLLVWFPFAYLVITLPVYAWSLRKSQLGTVPVSPLSITKQVISSCKLSIDCWIFSSI